MLNNTRPRQHIFLKDDLKMFYCLLDIPLRHLLVFLCCLGYEIRTRQFWIFPRSNSLKVFFFHVRLHVRLLPSRASRMYISRVTIVILVYIIYLPLPKTCLRAQCIGERAKRRVSIIMKFRKRPARRKGASPGDNDLCHLCCCEDGGRVDNLC